MNLPSVFCNNSLESSGEPEILKATSFTKSDLWFVKGYGKIDWFLEKS